MMGKALSGELSCPCDRSCFPWLSIETYVGYRLAEMVLMRGHNIYIQKCLSSGTPNTTNFLFVPNGKWSLLGVPIFEHNIIRL